MLSCRSAGNCGTYFADYLKNGSFYTWQLPDVVLDTQLAAGSSGAGLNSADSNGFIAGICRLTLCCILQHLPGLHPTCILHEWKKLLNVFFLLWSFNHSKQNSVPNVLQEQSYPAWGLDKHRTNISHIMDSANCIIGNTQFEMFKLYFLLANDSI